MLDLHFLFTALAVITTPPVNVTVVTPREAVLTCSAEGFPVATVIEWTRVNDDGSKTVLTEGENTMISESDMALITTSNLTLFPTDLSLNGVYVCTATNGLRSANASAIVTVNGEAVILFNTGKHNITHLQLINFAAPPIITKGPSPDLITTFSGDHVLITCISGGNPLPMIFWKLNNNLTTLEELNGFNVTQATVSRFEQMSTLTFTALDGHFLRGNLTSFTCVAGNTILSGVMSKPTVLIVAGIGFCLLVCFIVYS